MKDGFIKVCTATPDIQVADCDFNAEQIISLIKENARKGAKCIVFPELCITGYTCADLFLQSTLLSGAENALQRITKASEAIDAVVVVGLPLAHNNKLYNVAAVICHGEVIGLVPKTNIPSYSEFYESRHFAAAGDDNTWHRLCFQEDEVFFGKNLIFRCEEDVRFSLSVEICEDLWMPIPPSSYHVQAGANMIVNLSASDETTGKKKYRRDLIKGQSARTLSAYLYADAGEGESTTDMVFAGHNIIAENGFVLAETERFCNGSLLAEVDLELLCSERRRMTTFPMHFDGEQEGYDVVEFSLAELPELNLTRTFEKTPFVPEQKNDREERCEEVLNIQSAGLKKRLMHTKCQTAVLGLSGGLDSTLALLVTARTFDMLGMSRENIICITMPCFGTTDRTYQNAILLAGELGTTCREISIRESVTLHFQDIGHDINNHDITYENGQARERTQILMDVANKCNGLVIGTGDMSELALGWATYNGDHMSMYGVNSSVPKTLVRFLVQYYADTCHKESCKAVLYDVLDTPVSPELLPPKDGEIIQRTEDIVGPYELHDFFLYYVMRFGFSPSKIYRMAVTAFDGKYEGAVIRKWLQTFYRRFFQQQFKRSCMPDGPKVGSVALSPRGDLRMPSDASLALWQKELESLVM